MKKYKSIRSTFLIKPFPLSVVRPSQLSSLHASFSTLTRYSPRGNTQPIRIASGTHNDRPSSTDPTAPLCRAPSTYVNSPVPRSELRRENGNGPETRIRWCVTPPRLPERRLGSSTSDPPIDKNVCSLGQVGSGLRSRSLGYVAGSKAPAATLFTTTDHRSTSRIKRWLRSISAPVTRVRNWAERLHRITDLREKVRRGFWSVRAAAGCGRP